MTQGVMTPLTPLHHLQQHPWVGIATLIFRYFLAIFLRATEQICPDSARTFHSFDPVGFAIFAISRTGDTWGSFQAWVAKTRCKRTVLGMAVPPCVELLNGRCRRSTARYRQNRHDLHGLAGEDREMRVLLEQLGGRLSDRRYRRI